MSQHAHNIGQRQRPLRVCSCVRRLVDDSFTCDASRKKAAFGDVGQYLASLDPARTIIAGNLECAGEPGGQRESAARLQHTQPGDFSTA